LLKNGNVIANEIASISSSVSGKVITVTLTADDGTVLNTQLYLNN
jgi:hypothetical protein